MESVRGDSLVLRPIRDSWDIRYRYLADTGVRVSLGLVERLEVRRNVRGRLWKGLGIGVLSGAAIGAAVGFASGDDASGWVAFSAEEKAGLLAFLGAPAGGVVGLLTASATAKRWQLVPREGLRVAVVAPPRRPGVALRISAPLR